jgi:cysteine-rich repeat protein
MDIPRSTEGTTKVLERNNIPLAGVSPRPRVQEVPLCGNARREDGEECDDGNIARFDGCSPSCRVETGWSCYRRQAADEAAGDECLEASPEDVLFVVNFVGRSSPRSGVLNYDRDLCLSDCSHCLSQHIDRECHGYCYHGISESYRNCSFFGADCRDEITGETIQELCVFKEYDAIARCAFHARCTAVVCFNTNDLHPAVDSKRLCIAYDASLAEIRSRNGARFEVRDDVKRMDPWVYVPICQSAACTTIFLPPKMEHRMYMLGENEINQTRAAIQYTDELVRRSILEREKIQQTLNLIGRGLARGHGTEHKLAGQITQWMKNETALVEERLKMSERLQVPFRRSTIVSTLTVQEWEEQQKSRLNRRKIVAGARDIGSLSERKRPGRS